MEKEKKQSCIVTSNTHHVYEPLHTLESFIHQSTKTKKLKTSLVSN